jgi:formate dehydrogenase
MTIQSIPSAGPQKKGGRRRPNRTPKGRQVDLDALEEVRALLLDRPRRRDLLIEHLHLIQDHYGHLSAAHLTALAAEMRMALTEVYEVATFYSHFDVVKDGPPPPPVTVRVCDSLSCAMAGSEKLIAELAAKLGKNVRVVRAPCMGACDRAPVVAVGHLQTFKATPDKVAADVKADKHPHAWSKHVDLAAYQKERG